MFSKKSVPIQKELFSNLLFDYLSKNEKVFPFYNFFPDRDGFEQGIKSIANYNYDRQALVNVIEYDNLKVANTSSLSKKNTESLLSANTYTITTGHQLCLFTGPAYFIYKIVSVINLCETLTKEFPACNFIPVYWMASEDHDFDEANHFNVFGKKIEWTTHQAGAVGDFNTENLSETLKQFKDVLGNSVHSKVLCDLFEQSYLNHSNLADATRFLVNELFGKYGIVIVDANNKILKSKFKKRFENDAFNNEPFKQVNSTLAKLEALNYSVQVKPREINLFYMDKGIRSRIEKEGDSYKVIGTDLIFAETELRSLITNQPEKISPNVVLRPCYQQFILPNLAYVGGPGELAYWLEYKLLFEKCELFFPILTPRKFVTVIDSLTLGKLNKLNFNMENVFEGEQEMIKLYLEKNNKSFDLEAYKKSIENIFQELSKEVAEVDKTLVASAESEKQKSLKSIDLLEQKALRAVKQKSETEINQIKSIKSKLFPNGIPQERVENFSTYYSKWGNEFMDALKDNLTYDLKKKSELEIIFEN